MGRRTLVIGASGILAPLAAALAAAGDEVTGVARTRSAPPGVATVLVDAGSPDALRSELGGGDWECAVVYAPAVSADSLAAVAALVSGRTVVVRTSASADPGRHPPARLDVGFGRRDALAQPRGGLGGGAARARGR